MAASTTASSAAWRRLLYAPTDVGPMGLSRLVAVPDVFRRLPRRIQDPLAYRSIRPAGAAWLTPRLQDVPISLAQSIVSVSHRTVKASRSRSPTAGSEPSITCCLARATALISPATRSLRHRCWRACGGSTATPYSDAGWSRQSRDCISSAPRPRGASDRSCASCPAGGTQAVSLAQVAAGRPKGQAVSAPSYRDGHASDAQ